jgi:hypothetical protein
MLVSAISQIYAPFTRLIAMDGNGTLENKKSANLLDL